MQDTPPPLPPAPLPGMPPLDQLIACPQCDLLHAAGPVPSGQRARCARCGTRLIAPRDGAFLRVILFGATVAILMVGAVFFPFLGISAQGLTHRSSVFDAALAFSDGILMPLSVMVLALIVAIPILRVAALTYTLWPLVNDRAPLRYAPQAMRLAEAIRPWSMAEIFIIGVAVALVKVAGLASISFGPAFWAFCAMVVVVALSDTFMCKWTIWAAIERNRVR